MVEYRIAEKSRFAVIGISRMFHPETRHQQIPEYRAEMFGQPDFPLMGVYGICMDNDGAGAAPQLSGIPLNWQEVYGPPREEDRGESCMELWLPVEKV